MQKCTTRESVNLHSRTMSPKCTIEQTLESAYVQKRTKRKSAQSANMKALQKCTGRGSVSLPKVHSRRTLQKCTFNASGDVQRSAKVLKCKSAASAKPLLFSSFKCTARDEVQRALFHTPKSVLPLHLKLENKSGFTLQ